MTVILAASVEAQSDDIAIDLIANLVPSDLSGGSPVSYPGSERMVWTAEIDSNGTEDAVDVDFDLQFSRSFFHVEVVCRASAGSVCPDSTAYSITPGDAPTNVSVVIPKVSRSNTPNQSSLEFEVIGYTAPSGLNGATMTGNVTVTAGPGFEEVEPSTNSAIQNILIDSTVADVEVTKRILPASEGGSDYNDWGDTMTYEVTVENLGPKEELLGVGIIDQLTVARTGGTGDAALTLTDTSVVCTTSGGPAGFECPPYLSTRTGTWSPGSGTRGTTNHTLFSTQDTGLRNDSYIMPIGAKLTYRVQFTTVEPTACSRATGVQFNNRATLTDIAWDDQVAENNTEGTPNVVAGADYEQCPPDPTPNGGGSATKMVSRVQPDGTTFDEWGDALHYTVTYTNSQDFDITGMDFRDYRDSRRWGSYIAPEDRYVRSTLLDPADPNDGFAFRCNYTGTGECPTFSKTTSTHSAVGRENYWTTNTEENEDWVFEAGSTITVDFWVRIEPVACFPSTATKTPYIRNHTTSIINGITDPVDVINRTMAAQVDAVLVPLEPCPTFDIAVSKTQVDPAPGEPVGFGDEITYEVSYENLGENAATINVRDVVTSAVRTSRPRVEVTQLECIFEEGTTCPEFGTNLPFNSTAAVYNGTWRDFLGEIFRHDVEMPPGAKFGFRIAIVVPRANNCGTLNLNQRADFKVVSSENNSFDSVASNNVAAPQIPLPLARCVDLVTQKSQDVAQPAPGVPFNYTLTISNTIGEHTAINASFSDPLKNYIQLAGTPTCEVSAGDAVCPVTFTGEVGGFGQDVSGVIPSLPAGSAIKISIPVQTEFIGSLANKFSTEPGPDTIDKDLSNDEASVNIFAAGEADTWLKKERLPKDGAPYIPGDVISWKIIAGNNGPDSVAGVWVQDIPGDGLTAVEWTCEAVAPNDCTRAGEGNLFDRQAALVAGGTVEYTIYAKTDPDRTEPVLNDAITSPPAGTTDADLTNNEDDTESEPAIPSVELVKSVASTNLTIAGSNNRADAGDTLTYSFELFNTGGWNLDIDADSVTDDVLAASIPEAVITCPDVTLAPGTSVTCTATAYTLTQIDIDRGGLENSANVTVGVVHEDGKPVLQDARDGDTAHEVSDVSDTGTEAGTDGETPDTIPDGEDVETDNPLEVFPNDETDPDEDPTTWLFKQAPEITLVKSLAQLDASVVAPDTLVQPGDVAEYTFTVFNTGNITLDDITITDDVLSISNQVCTTETLPPGDSTECEFDTRYVLTQADIDNQGVENSATVDSVAVLTDGTVLAESVSDVSDTGTDVATDQTPPGVITEPGAVETNNPLDINDSADNKDDPTTLLLTPKPSIELRKAVTSVDLTVTGPADRADAGDTVTYQFVARNNGNTHLTEILVSDPMVGINQVPCTNDPLTLAPGETVTCDVAPIYTLTKDDIDRGGVENSAVATATPVRGDGGPLLTDINDPDSPAMAPITDTSDTASEAGTGGQTPEVIGEPGAVETDNPLDQNPNDGDDDGDDPTTWFFTPKPELVLVKSVSDTDATVVGSATALDAGDTVTYSFAVTNTGNTHLADITIDDARLGVTDIACVDSLDIDETVACSGTITYTLTQDDIDARGVENTAVVSAFPVNKNGDPLSVDPTDPDAGTIGPVIDVSDTGTEPGSDIEDAKSVDKPATTETGNPLGEHVSEDAKDDPTTWLITPAPGVELVKAVAAVDLTVAGPDDRADVGDTVTYSFTVTNTGNTHLTNVVFDDAKLNLVDAACADFVAIGTTATCTTIVEYALTQDDIDNNGVENTATVTATPSDNNGDALLIDKNNPDAGTYGPITDISDSGSKVGTNDDDPESITDPGDEETSNPLGENISTDEDDDPTTWLVAREASIEIIKSVAAVDLAVVGPPGRADAGDTITYSFTVTNTGNVRLANVVFSDEKLSIVDASCIDLLAPGDAVTCPAATYALTQADIAAGGIENVASVTGTPVDKDGELLPVGTVTDASDTGTDAGTDSGDINTIDEPGSVETTNSLGADDPNGNGDNGDNGDDPTTWLFVREPGIVVVKSISEVNLNVVGDGFVDAGDTITYTFAVTNTGNVDLVDITIDDDILGQVNAPCVALLAVGETAECAATYTLTEADVEAGGVVNTASASGTPVDVNGHTFGANRVSDTSDTGSEATNDDQAIESIVDPGGVASRNEFSGGDTASPGDDPTIALFSPRPTPQGTATPGSKLAFTGSTIALFVFLGAGFLTAGILLSQTSRRLRRVSSS